jgi:hypothetical protein
MDGAGGVKHPVLHVHHLTIQSDLRSILKGYQLKTQKYKKICKVYVTIGFFSWEQLEIFVFPK